MEHETEQAPEFPTRWHYDAYVEGCEREIAGAKVRLQELKDVPGAEVTIAGLKDALKNAEAELDRVRALDPGDDAVVTARGLSDEQMAKAAELVNGGLTRDEAEAQVLAEAGEETPPVPLTDEQQTKVAELVAAGKSADDAEAEVRAAETAPPEPTPEKSLDDMNLNELRAHAETLGIDVAPFAKPGTSKAKVRAAIDAKLQA